MSGEPLRAIIYDGQCPFCSRYVRLLRLRKALGPIALVDARGDHPLVRRLQARGIDLNDGMALVDGDRISHGSDCIHQLALMSTPSGLFNRANAAIFRSPTASRLLDPVLRAARNMTLRALGRKSIPSDGAGS